MFPLGPILTTGSPYTPKLDFSLLLVHVFPPSFDTCVRFNIDPATIFCGLAGLIQMLGSQGPNPLVPESINTFVGVEDEILTILLATFLLQLVKFRIINVDNVIKYSLSNIFLMLNSFAL